MKLRAVVADVGLLVIVVPDFYHGNAHLAALLAHCFSGFVSTNKCAVIMSRAVRENH